MVASVNSVGFCLLYHIEITSHLSALFFILLSLYTAKRRDLILLSRAHNPFCLLQALFFNTLIFTRYPPQDAVISVWL